MAKPSAKVTAPTINIGIGEKDRAAIAKGLSQLLADTYTLYLTTHNFHWNVTGPMFTSLHTMFMTQYTELWNAVDPVAERIPFAGPRCAGQLRAVRQAQLGARRAGHAPEGDGDGAHSGAGP